MDVTALMDYLPLYGEALMVTLSIGWIGVAGSIVLGLVGAMVIHWQVPVIKTIFRAYIAFFRNTPLLIQLFFMYFGLPRLGISISPEVCGSVGLALLGGAYMAETFRSGLEAVPPIQPESATALGLTPMQVARFVVIPQALTIAWPSFVANVIFILKETSVFSAISLMDLMFLAKDLIGLYYQTTEALFMLVVFYLIVLLPVSVAGSIVERRLRHGVARV